MNRTEIMQQIKKVTGTRHFVRRYEGESYNMEKISESRAFDMFCNINLALFAYRARTSLHISVDH
jgi:hypothetical protein